MSIARQRYILLAIVCMFYPDTSRMLGQFAETQPQTTAEQISHFSETLSVPTRSGAPRMLAIQIDDWDFPLGDTEFDAPPDGTVIMQVRQGSLSVRVAKVSKTYSTGDYWTIPAGAHVTISLPSSAHDNVIVRTITTIPMPEQGKSRRPTMR